MRKHVNSKGLTGTYIKQSECEKVFKESQEGDYGEVMNVKQSVKTEVGNVEDKVIVINPS